MAGTPTLKDCAVPQHARMGASATYYEGAIMDVVVDEFALGGGEPMRREYIRHDDAVAVLALRSVAAGEEALLIRQYRHPIRHIMWEIPAGLLDIDGEDSVVAAQRELYEEADLVGGELTQLVQMYATPGCSTELYTIYVARGCTEADVPFERTEEEAEIERFWVPFDELLAAVQRGDLRSPTLVAATLAYAAQQLSA